MTKIILTGGYPSKAPDGGSAFCRELVVGLQSPVKILEVLFARGGNQWDETIRRDQAFITQHVPNIRCSLQAAEANTLSAQVDWADVVYIKGGMTAPLMTALAKSTDWLGHLSGKTVAGTSAGAYALCRYYHELDASGVHKGLGLLPYKILTHWQSSEYGTLADWTKYEHELVEFGKPVPMLKLKEGEFRVFETSESGPAKISLLDAPMEHS